MRSCNTLSPPSSSLSSPRRFPNPNPNSTTYPTSHNLSSTYRSNTLWWLWVSHRLSTAEKAMDLLLGARLCTLWWLWVSPRLSTAEKAMDLLLGTRLWFPVAVAWVFDFKENLDPPKYTY
ncbi:hypothetical protein FCV25MIE_05075 [Fagus crenata]